MRRNHDHPRRRCSGDARHPQPPYAAGTPGQRGTPDGAQPPQPPPMQIKTPGWTTKASVHAGPHQRVPRRARLRRRRTKPPTKGPSRRPPSPPRRSPRPASGPPAPEPRRASAPARPDSAHDGRRPRPRRPRVKTPEGPSTVPSSIAPSASRPRPACFQDQGGRQTTPGRQLVGQRVSGAYVRRRRPRKSQFEGGTPLPDAQARLITPGQRSAGDGFKHAFGRAGLTTATDRERERDLAPRTGDRTADPPPRNPVAPTLSFGGGGQPPSRWTDHGRRRDGLRGSPSLSFAASPPSHRLALDRQLSYECIGPERRRMGCDVVPRRSPWPALVPMPEEPSTRRRMADMTTR